MVRFLLISFFQAIFLTLERDFDLFASFLGNKLFFGEGSGGGSSKSGGK